MCYITDENVKANIRREIKWFVDRKKTFTGHSVYDKLRPEVPGTGTPSFHMSAYVRELFNGNHEVFEGYCCYPVPKGPLMFFPIPWYGKINAKKIKDKIEAKKESQAS